MLMAVRRGPPLRHDDPFESRDAVRHDPGRRFATPTISRRGCAVRALLGQCLAESFFSSLKKEWIKKQIYKNGARALNDVADYIDRFYNQTRRPQSSMVSMTRPNIERGAFPRAREGRKSRPV